MFDILLDLLKVFLSCIIIGGVIATVWHLNKKYFGKKTTLRH